MAHSRSESSHNGRLSELGISEFDPLYLHSKDSSSDFANSRISTYYYAKGGSKDRVNYKPYRLGTPQPRLRNEDLENILNTHFRPSQPDGEPRDVILIGHNITCDLSSIEECSGISLSDISNITTILDTQAIARLVLSTNRSSLKHILQHMKLNFVGLHNAGHDSRYTLRAVLMLFVLYKHQSAMKRPEDFAITELLTEIAQSHQINASRKWTTPTTSKSASISDIFSQEYRRWWYHDLAYIVSEESLGDESFHLLDCTQPWVNTPLLTQTNMADSIEVKFLSGLNLRQ